MKGAFAAAAMLLAVVPPDGTTLSLNHRMRVRVEAGRAVILERLDAEGAVASATPVERLDDDLRVLVLRSLFPKDRTEGTDWVHVARAGVVPTYDEGLWQVASWFTGSGDNFEALRRANALLVPDLSPGQEVRIPYAMLDPAFRPRARSDDGSLEFGKDGKGEYAGYRLRPGEALWSAVVVRFTGRTAKEDVEAVASEIAARSGIPDLTDIPAGWLVKIPLDVLEPEFLPPGNPRRVAAEAERIAAEAELRASPATGKTGTLDGVVVILDPGHGGRDLGTLNHGIWEHDYVYDVCMRVKRRLESGTGAKVVLTLVDDQTGTDPSAGDALQRNFRGTIQTHPPFLADGDEDTSVGVNLRWYLANSVYREAVKAGTNRDRVVFLSLHADSRHPSLRGAMFYVPGASYRAGTYGSASKTYMRFREVRERPHVKFTRKERLRSEAVSRKLADRLVDSFRAEGLPVQDFKPVRERVIRGRSVWLPAVLRGNEVPAKVLIEMVNLSNADDAGLLSRAADRERLAAAVAAGLEAHFGKKP